MKIPSKLLDLLEKAEANCSISKEECAFLLKYSDRSCESGIIKAAADHYTRRRFQNRAALLGQIGMESSFCPGRCKFCAFGEEHSVVRYIEMSKEQIVEQSRLFSESGNLFALFLMTMHQFDYARLLDVVSAVRQSIPRQTRIVVNTGDLEGTQGDELRCAGADGAYHIYRLREGMDTGLSPRQRLRTLEIIRCAGLDLYYCCEPVGPEHSPDELAEQIFIGIEFGCFQHGAMRRIPVPGTPLGSRGRITESRLAQIVSVTAMATLSCRETGLIIVHEPSILGISAGANGIYAEAGANPRDVAADTKGNRGMDLIACRELLYEAGFSGLLQGITF